ncbi:Co2+/Mg2+ efflux protein ApaG [Sphingorhabdus sp. Alg239-R122]|uniref:Co2+/Mg2+ efflux protein ApaG n=1 Tax=Sphingorhabdus sp. Alg239-R122 TaxID=2305989 RepID=UPI0013DBFFC0|nr:Co2+/Mg2+ efflux protein ApaG [Sphingorhabdus sp. Alg239-R122]
MHSFFDHNATTQDITVRASVTYLHDQSEADKARWFWSYHIRIENHGDKTMQLLTRHWHITDGRGGVHIVDGEGVVGEQPVLEPGQTHDYVSGCPLNTPTGSMKGHFRMLCADDSMIDVDIPHFPLVAPATAR